MVTNTDRQIRSGDSIKAILQNFALEHKINILSLDYMLISYKSYVLKDGKVQIDDINAYIDTNYTIKQDYEVEIFRRQSSFYPILIQVQTNDNNTELKALIYTQRIPQVENLEEIIYKTILNICAYRGIIINLGWNDITKDIAQITQKLRSNEAQPEYYSIDIVKLKEPSIKSRSLKLILSKNKTDSILSHDSLLLSGGFFSVGENEKLLEYKKPIYDSMWRNVYGNIYGTGLSYPIGIEAGEGVEQRQEGDSIVFYSTINGYVSIVGGTMMIKDTITLEHVNQENATMLEEQGVNSLIIKNESLIKDAIASGVKLEMQNLKIFGNISSVDIKSQDILIDGQVHIKSNIKASKAQILNFKGNLEAKEAEIRYCDNANIKCDNIFINQINGSKVYLHNGRILNVQSNNFFFIQKSLIISNIAGKHNEFILYPCLFGEQKDVLDNLNSKLLYTNKLQNLLELDNHPIYSNKQNDELIYKHLSTIDLSLIDNNLYDMQNTLEYYKQKAQKSSLIADRLNSLLANINQKKQDIINKIRQKQEEMFNIELVFENECCEGFYVRFINFYGIEQRYLINASENNAIKKVMLARKDNENGIKIVCYKE